MKPSQLLPLVAALLSSHVTLAADEPATFRLDEVVVKGKARPTETDQRQQSNVSKIIIGKKELEQSGDLSAADYLKKIPGLGAQGNRGNSIASGAPQILIDGVPVSGGRARGVALSRIALDMIERIEVTRSATAALSNESAGAVVNIVLKNNVQQSVRGGLNLAVGEHVSRVGGLFSGQVSAREDDFTWVLAGSFFQRGNLRTTESDTHNFNTLGAPIAWTVEREDGRGDNRNLNLTPKLTWQLNATDRLLIEPSITASQSNFDSHRTLFAYADFVNGTGLASTGSRREDSNSDELTLKLRGDWQRKQGQSERTLRAGVQRGINHSDKTTQDFNTLNVLTGTRTEDGTARDWAVDVSAQIKEPVAGNHLITTGVEVAWRKLDDEKNSTPPVAVSATAFNIREQSWVAYVQDEWALSNNMALTPGLRFRHIERDSEDGAGVSASASSSTFSPSLHYAWKLSDMHSLRASASHILKPPAFSDLTTVINTGDGTQTRPDSSGNAHLKNETAWVYNLGLEHYLADKAGVVGINFFYRDLTDLIQRRTLPEGARYVSRPTNIGDAAIWGAELDAKSQMGNIGLPDLTLRGNFVTQNSRAKDNATGETGQVGDLPEYAANLGADYHFVAQKLVVSLNLRLAGKQNRGVGDLETLKVQQFLSLSATQKLSKTTTIRLGGHNLLNAQSDRTAISFHPAPDTNQIASNQHAVETTARFFYFGLENTW